MAASVREGRLQFYAIQCDTQSSPTPVSYQMNLVTTEGCAEAIIAAINLYRLLHGAEVCLPTHVLPMD